MRARVLHSFREVPAPAWDALTRGQPFLAHAFLATLEELGDAARADWRARPVVVEDDHGVIVGAAPAWERRSSMGEFVYDFALADAAARVGLPWYPKLVVAVPFTPVTGPRLLGTEAARGALVDGLRQAALGCAGIHVLFPPASEPTWLAEHGFARRVQHQYHWCRHGWTDFEGWLRDAFTSADRCEIRRERRRAREGLAIEVHDAPSPGLLFDVGTLWATSVGRFGPWGNAWIAPGTLASLGERWPGHMQVVTAREGSRLVAATWNVRGPGRLFGRVWAPAEERRFLHFELCYYQGIDWCLAHGVDVFEPGHGGEHKRSRGFQSTRTFSAHRVAHAGLHRAVATWFDAEAASLDDG